MLHLISLDKRVCHSKCNYFVPLLCKMDEEENRNSSYDPFHTVATGLKKEIPVKM
jgi:hypothetical protein